MTTRHTYLFILKGLGEAAHVALIVRERGGEIFLFCNLFTIFLYFCLFVCFCSRSLAICIERDVTSPGICIYLYKYIYIKKKKKKFLCSDFFSLVSYMLRLFFQTKENNMNICKLRQNKDVQNKVLNVYCTLYSICPTRRVNVSILRGGFGGF